MEILTDPHHSRGDLRLVKAAIRKGWDIPDHLLETLPSVASELAKSGNPREQIAAIGLLVKMKESNDKAAGVDKPLQSPSQTTINVGVKVENNTDTGRNLASQIVERIRLERVSGDDT